MATTPDPKQHTFLPSRGVKRRYGNCSDMTIWRWQNDPAMNFPKPYYFGRLKYWRVDELEAFDGSRPQETTKPTCLVKRLADKAAAASRQVVA